MNKVPCIFCSMLLPFLHFLLPLFFVVTGLLDWHDPYTFFSLLGCRIMWSSLYNTKKCKKISPARKSKQNKKGERYKNSLDSRAKTLTLQKVVCRSVAFWTEKNAGERKIWASFEQKLKLIGLICGEITWYHEFSWCELVKGWHWASANKKQKKKTDVHSNKK